ncbi:MAG: hypothetical protein KF841_06385 [Phycisphaerae bacterium]|nr:hypothetical protein [Phycisphaerae bacterium]
MRATGKSCTLYSSMGAMLVFSIVSGHARADTGNLQLFHHEAGNGSKIGFASTELGEWTAGSDLAEASRIVRVDDAAISALRSGKATSVLLALTDDIRATGTVDRFFEAPEGDFCAAGRIDGDSASWVILVLHDGVLAGSVGSPGIGIHEIKPLRPGWVAIRKVDQDSQRGRACAATNLPAESPGTARGASSICPLQGSPLAGFVADDGSTIDIMFVYTAGALASAGSQTNLIAEISAAVTYANNAYVNSGIGTELRLVHVAPVSYEEEVNAVTNLNRLVEMSDGFLDSVHADRDVHGADLVCLVVNNTMDSGGVAYQLYEFSPIDDGRYGFSVVREDNLLFETLAHEVGHNFGCQHDRCNPQGTPFFEFGYGYRQPCPGPPPTPCSTPWPCVPSKDIMSYPPGMTVPYFSTPSVLVGGLPIGGTDELGGWCDNAEAHNGTAFTVANFRPSTVTPTPPSRLYVNQAAAGTGDGTTWNNAITDLQDAIGLAARARGAVTEIWVAEGVYRPDRGSGDRYATFRAINGVAIYGGFGGGELTLEERDTAAHPTIMSGDIGSEFDIEDNSYHVLIASDRDQTAVIDGFSIVGGNADGPYWPLNAGGGLLSQCSAMVVRDCRITENFSSLIGGGVYTEESTELFEDCVISTNISQNGGGVETSSSSPSFRNTEFHANLAEFVGGGANCNGGAPIFESCRFLDNATLSQFGFFGAIRSTSGADPLVTDCVFMGNSAYAVAAVGVDYGGHIVILDSEFTQNFADFSGSIELFEESAVISRCKFVANHAGAEEGSGHGGAITLINGASAELTDCEFVGNSADFGGGAIACFNSDLATERCVFVGNEAWYGGAIWSDLGATRNTNARMHGNHATYGGGAVHASGGGTHDFVNCILTGNQAPAGWGGAFFNYSGANVLIDHCTIASNSAPTGEGGGVHSDGNTTRLTHSIVWGNTAFGGMNQSAQVAGFGDPIYLIDYCDIQNWDGSLGGFGNFGLNPFMTDVDGADNIIGTPDDDVRLLPGSPCIDAGDVSYVAPDTGMFDIDGEPRIMGCRVDIGADEFTGGERNSGDMNADAVVNLSDIPLFVGVLLNGGTPTEACIADMNNNGTVNGADIELFVFALLSP